uniref:Ferredoxin n=1 Tax=Octactis speculum TaxID=3111310 RepID=A0A7S2BL04_9STRA|mmetsp:Transcript_24229/g.33162  ORF Transcript_24229/g.33162 Transcript_24229/m.33162 type:complete len:365 (+) Transcript_24229:20-1114(+)
MTCTLRVWTCLACLIDVAHGWQLNQPRGFPFYLSQRAAGSNSFGPSWEDSDTNGTSFEGSFWETLDGAETLDDGPESFEQWSIPLDPSQALDQLANSEQEQRDWIDKADRKQELRSKNLTDEQIRFYLQEDSYEVSYDAEPQVDSDLATKFREITSSGDNAFGQVVDVSQIGIVDSNLLVELDEDGEPYTERFVYVDEHSCIGCTNCACIAKSTFMMEEEHGRARVFLQSGDSPETVEEAIDTCPVDCIHYVPWEELVALETRRQSQFINNKARLVNQQEGRGVDVASLVGGVIRRASAPDISGNRGMRCNNCPGRGCKSCPMYGVGKNPAFLEREQEKMEKRARRDAARAAEDSVSSGDVASF